MCFVRKVNATRQLIEMEYQSACKQGWMNKNTGAQSLGGKTSLQCGGGTSILHFIAQPTPRKRSAQLIADVFEDAQPLERVEVKKQE